MDLSEKVDLILAAVERFSRPEPPRREGFLAWLFQVNERERKLAVRAEVAEDRCARLESQVEELGEVNECLRSWLLSVTAVAAKAVNVVAPPDPRLKYPQGERKQA